MKILNTVTEVREYIKEQKKKGLSIGLVPTMGYLHDGHLSLIKKSTEKNDITVISIFVNPTQFSPNEDLDKYPRDFERDSKIAMENGVDVLFYPSVSELYPKNFQTYVTIENLSKHLCGKSRPTHFRGVTTIVSKLFNIVTPDNAYFGQKDAQQYFVLKRMVEDLNFDIHLVMCPIIREKDGLALSSRNVYLNQEERRQALCLNQSLKKAKELVVKGEKYADIIADYIKETIEKNDLANIDYIEVVDTETLESVQKIEGRILIALAVKFGNTRLIDNIIIE
ncbi:MAG: pantoate--beta-alanine ligase [Anaerovoracaceae bacterium]|jgi:pantoate--beta-alanine ligase